jgi:hypothetical protein
MGIRTQDFALAVLAELRQRDHRAEALRLQPTRPSQDVVMGLDDDGEFVPLLKLASASAAVNVMSLFVRHQARWVPTFQRGTPAQLAQALAGPLQHLWLIAVIAQSSDTGSSAQ